jgi:hypothetical protein
MWPGSAPDRPVSGLDRRAGLHRAGPGAKMPRVGEVIFTVGAVVFVVAYSVVWLTAVADLAGSSLSASERLTWFAILIVFHVIGPYAWFRFSRSRAPYGWPTARS